MYEKSMYNEVYEQQRPPEVVIGYDELHNCIDPIIQRIENEGKSLTNDVKDFFQEFYDRNGGGILINDKENNKIVGYQIVPSSDPELVYDLGETTLYVNDPAQFIMLLQELHDTIYSGNYDPAIEKAIFGQSITKIWSNATSGDFQHPEIFVGRMINLIRDETFVPLKEWTKTGDVTVNGSTEHLFVKHASLPASYETPHDLRFAISEQEFPTSIDDLPAVRYGIIEPGMATIYAIQMPRIGSKTESTYLEKQETIKKRCVTAHKYFTDLYETEPEFMRTWMPDFPTETFDSTNDNTEDLLKFGKTVDQYFIERAESDGYDDYVTWAREKVGNTAFVYQLVSLSEALLYAEEKENIQDQLNLYQMRRDRLPRYTQAIKENNSNEFRGAPPTSLISLTAAVRLLHNEGVDEFLIPAYLPGRKHADDSLDERILNQTMQTIGRLATEVQGIEIEADPEEDGYFHFKVTGDLTSKNPLLQSIIMGTGKFDVL